MSKGIEITGVFGGGRAKHSGRIIISRAEPWPAVALRHGTEWSFHRSIEDALAEAPWEPALVRTWNRVRRFEIMFSRGDNASRHAERTTVNGRTWIECCVRCMRPLANVEGGCSGTPGCVGAP